MPLNKETKPTPIGITIIFLFHSFFSFLTKSKYLSIFSIYGTLELQHPEYDKFFFSS